MTATRVNAIFDIGIALALGVISGAVAVMAMQGCKSEPEAGGCGGVVKREAICLPRTWRRAGANPATRSASGLDEKVGGCGVERHAGTQAAQGKPRVTRPTSLRPSRATARAESRGPVARHPQAGIESGQPSISLEVIAPAGSRAGTCFGVEPPSVVGDGPSGMRFEEGNSGRGETRTLRGKQANASADLLAWTSTEADRYPPFFAAIRAVESAGDDLAVGDSGRSKGPYQCGRAAFFDGGGKPEDYDRLVWDRAACEKVMLAYWKRYGAVTDEDRAKCWNVGPRWRTRAKATGEKYWQKVKKVLEETSP